MPMSDDEYTDDRTYWSAFYRSSKWRQACQEYKKLFHDGLFCEECEKDIGYGDRGFVSNIQPGFYLRHHYGREEATEACLDSDNMILRCSDCGGNYQKKRESQTQANRRKYGGRS